MYSIGDLAQLAGVTPRMLRHYHELGLLVPAEVDDSTGYRRYHETQLADLLQALALKGLGFSLTDIGRVAKGGVSPAELRGMLLLRRTEVEAELAEASARLERVESHIRRLENEMNDRSDATTAVEVTTKRLPAVHLAVLSGVSPTFDSADIGPVIQPLYPRLMEALVTAGVEIFGSPTAYYDDSADGGIGVHAGFPVDAAVTELPGAEIVDLPEVELAATAVHLGDMATVDVDTVAPILTWIDANRFRTIGYSREVYLHCPEDLSQWRTELQFPIEPAPAGS